MLYKIKLAIRRLLMFIPTRLPVGASEYQTWMDEIIELTGPIADKRSMEFVISSTMVHADVKRVARIPKYYFVARLIKAAANQCAHYKFQEIKMQQAEDAERNQQQAVAKATGAVTPSGSDASNGQQKQA